MSFYSITEAIRNHLSASPDINVVTTGDYNQVDLNKQTIFGLAHIQPNNATINESTIDYSFNIIVLDLVDFNKQNVKNLSPDVYRGNDNLHDVWNTMLNVLNDLYLTAKKGELFDALIDINNPPNCEPFDMRFENGLAGWSMDVTFTIPNGHAIC
jgi:hypothetical protein